MDENEGGTRGQWNMGAMDETQQVERTGHEGAMEHMG